MGFGILVFMSTPKKEEAPPSSNLFQIPTLMIPLHSYNPEAAKGVVGLATTSQVIPGFL